LIAWLLYARKCERFVVRTLGRQDYTFLNGLSLLHAGRLYRLLLGVQFVLFLPVTLYVSVIVGVGLYQQWYAAVLLVFFYTLGICLVSARWYLYLLQNPGKARFTVRWNMPTSRLDRFYWIFFLHYLLKKRKILLVSIKIYSCGILYMMVAHQAPIEDDLRMIFLFYSFGLLGHGVLIHQLRELEETRLTFYRGLPLSLSRRYAQFMCLYFLLFLPEMITIGCLTPVFLHYADAFSFVCFGYSVLLLLNGLLFIRSFKMVDYLKIIVGVFFLTYIGILVGMIPWLAVFYFFLAGWLFFTRYYRYGQ
jgi:hypothetical protein